MAARLIRMGCLAALALMCLPTLLVADAPDSDWLTWTVKDCKNNTIDLSDQEDKTIYVVVFSPGNSDSCAWMRAMATYVRSHANKAEKVLGFCSDDTGCDAIKLHIRQEEWKKRVDAWNAAQDAAKTAAQQAGLPFAAPKMPDYLQQIKDEINDPEDFDALISHHLPFKTCQRCSAMWTWLIERMSSPEGSPRILKINAAGHLVHEWTEMPNPMTVD